MIPYSLNLATKCRWTFRDTDIGDLKKWRDQYEQVKRLNPQRAADATVTAAPYAVLSANCEPISLSRLENAPSLKDAIRLTWALVDQWMASYDRQPASVILDIDDTCDVVHGHQQLSLFNAHYDERCFLPIHVYDTERSRPVAVVLRPGKTPSGVEVRAHLRRLVRHIRQRWTRTRITFRGDGHYARPEAMEWCEANRVDYVFGLPGSKPLAKKIDEAAEAVRTERAVSNKVNLSP